jgi:hypothetical protein
MWFNSLFALLGSGSPRSRSGQRPASSRLRLEVLEDRSVPSSLTTTTTSADSQPVAALVSSSAASQSLHVSGTFDFQDNKTGPISGQATPLGSFSGNFRNQNSGAGRLQGTATLTFGTDSLTISYDLRLNRDTNQFVGTYQITGGTGTLLGASGSGAMTADHGSQGNFSLDGSISL